ncbi:hypothetical protein ARMSODRAFT_972125 [Armillaria solidipes]|uniref:Retrotransposon gag domain-containing protein n=1 Tax=Armillaria solidipes TaxID=1076256 RepID=A0A2H3C5Z1_9AGAR|nr:hypothetical protein ARMSODRAFT_972125 [Armillaria solidipes]
MTTHGSLPRFIRQQLGCPFTPSPLSESGSETPRLPPETPLPHPEKMMTPSTLWATTMTGLPLLTSTKRSSVSTTPRPGSYEEAISRLVTLPTALTTESRWDSISQPPGMGYAQEQPRNSVTWRLHYTPSPWNSATDPTWMGGMTPEEFDHFHYNKETALQPPQPPSRPPIPNHLRPLYKREDRYSVPCPPAGRGCPDPLPQLVGEAADSAPYLGIKPIMLQPPKLFKGEHDDIRQFLRDCITYFEAFTLYFILPSQTVPFAASHFKGPTKNCEFVDIINSQFWDPAIEEVHEKKMYNLWMGNGSTTTYFQEVEREAKLAGLHTDERECRAMVKAVRLGIPNSYSKFIANTSYNMPHMYPKWKACVIIMHEE